MTCIVGYIETKQKIIVMGGDSCVSTQSHAESLSKAWPKVFKRGEFLIGCSGYVRLLNILSQKFEPPKHQPDVSVDKYMVGPFTDAVRTALKDAGLAEKDKERESGGGVALIGYRGRLYKLDWWYQLIEYATQYASVGSGEQYALGALAVTEQLKNKKQAVKLALETAARFCPSVAGPFVIETVRY